MPIGKPVKLIIIILLINNNNNNNNNNNYNSEDLQMVFQCFLLHSLRRKKKIQPGSNPRVS